MDGERFDDLIRKICTTRLTRISALRGLVAGTAAAITGATLAADETDAKKKKRGGAKKGRGKKGNGRASTGGGRSSGRLRIAAICSLANVDVEDDTGPGEHHCALFNPALPGESLNDIGPTDGSRKVNIDGCECTVAWDFTSATTVEITTDCTIGGVVVKGGVGGQANVYTLDNCTGTIGPLTVPGGEQDISHIDICGIGCCEPATCESLEAECGAPDDGCGAPLDCGECDECRDSFCDEEFQCACDPDQCPANRTVPVGRPCEFDDGCCDTFECPCDTECASGGAPKSTCTDEGICACDPDECPAETTVPPGDQCRFRDGCCGTYECPCDTDCPGGGPNNTCTVEGVCACDPDECEAGKTIPPGEPCVFRDGCCGRFRCPCDTDCPGGGPNNTCTEGTCVCDPDECPAEKTVPAGEQCAFRDGCCGRYECPCDTSCPGGGPNNTCTDEGTCVCTPIAKDVACAGKCGQVDDGCCGTYTCECCNSCTQGYYKQNQCTQNGEYSWGGAARPGDALSTICPGGSEIQAYCISKGYTTIGKALNAKGNDVICAQFAAAYLNQKLTRGEHEDCTTLGIGNICALPKNSTSNATLSFWNEGGEQGFEICPNRGCGNS